jgi:hypothetical protein
LNKNELARLFGAADYHRDNGMSFASAPTTTSNQGSGSTYGSRSGSTDGKHSSEDAADVSMEPSQSDSRACDPNWDMPPLPFNKFSRDMTECLAGSLAELLNTQKSPAEVLPIPPMQDPFGFEHIRMPSFETPAEQAPAAESNDQPTVQYVPVPCISTPFGLYPVPPILLQSQARAGYAQQLMEQQLKEEALKKAVAPNGRGPTVSANNGEGIMLEQLLPDGRQRRPQLCEDTNRKVFVGGLNPATTAEGLRKHFEQFGTVSEASVVIDKVTRTSRGFGFVMFENAIPEGLLEKQHIIESRRCGVRDYGNAREN